MAPEAVPAALRSPQRCYETVAYPFVLLHSKNRFGGARHPLTLAQACAAPSSSAARLRAGARHAAIHRTSPSLHHHLGVCGPQRHPASPSQRQSTLVSPPARAETEQWRGGWCARATELTAVTEKLARSTAKAARRAGGIPPRAAHAGRRRKSSPAPASSARPHQRPGGAAPH